MNDPRRWKDDPQFADLLRGETDALGGTDMDALRSRVLNGPPPASPSWRPGRGFIGLGIGIGIAVFFLTPSPSTIVLPAAPVASVIAQHDSANRIASVRTIKAPPSAAEAVVPPTVPALPVAGEPDDVDVAVPTSPDVPSVVPPKTPEPISALEAELADYNLAIDAAEGERWPEARVRYEAYLEQWPAGRLRNEARMSLLIATVRSGAFENAQSIATALLADRTMRSRRADILWLKSQALVELDRCEAALEVLDLFDAIEKTPDSRRLRATCRRRR